jgi:hypothetical protein
MARFIPFLPIIVCAVAILLVMVLIGRRRRKIEYHMFSAENPLEALCWALLLGTALCILVVAAFPFFGAMLDQFEIKTEMAGTIVVTLFVAPALMLLAYWKRLDDARSKIPEGVAMLSGDKLSQRLAGFFFLERVAKESPTIFPTVIEILCAYVRSRTVDGRPEPGMEHPELLREVETKQCVDIISRLWRYNILKRNNLWNYNANLLPDLKNVDLHGLHLRLVDLSRFYLYKSDFSGSDLREANLFRADLSEAKFVGAMLDAACMCHADFSGADLDGASLNGTQLFGADLSGCRNLTQERIDAAFGDADTRLPVGLKHPGTWVSAPTRTCIGRCVARIFARPACANCVLCRRTCLERGHSPTPR